MNRPNKETLTEWSLNSYTDYTNELEKYCDELEASNIPNCIKLYIKQEAELKKLKEDYDKVMKALDKACEALEFVENSRNCESTVCSECKYCDAKYCIANRKNDWKEWLLKDE